jgi:hypothetical protein
MASTTPSSEPKVRRPLLNPYYGQQFKHKLSLNPNPFHGNHALPIISSTHSNSFPFLLFDHSFLWNDVLCLLCFRCVLSSSYGCYASSLWIHCHEIWYVPQTVLLLIAQLLTHRTTLSFIIPPSYDDASMYSNWRCNSGICYRPC